MFKKAVRGFGVAILFMLLAKGIGAAKEMVVAWRYGVSEIVDAYLFSFALVSLPVVVCTNVAFSTLVPILARTSGGSTYQRALFISEVLGFSIVLAIAIGLIEILGAESSLWALLLPHDHVLPYGMLVTFTLTQIYYAVLLIPSVLFSSLLIAEGKYEYALLDAIPAAVILAVVILFSDATGLSLVYGTVAGAAAYLFSLWRYSTQHITGISFGFSSSYWKEFKRSSSVMLTAQIPANVMLVADQVILSMATIGAISHFGYATRALSLFTSLGVMAISRVLLPIISDEWHAADSNKTEVLSRVRELVRIIGAASILFLAIGWSAAPGLVDLLFQRGSFSVADAKDVTTFLRLLIIQLPFYMAGTALVQILAAVGRHQDIAFGAMLNFAIKVGSSYLLFNWLGITGVALSFTIMYVCSSVYLLYCVNRVNRVISN